MIHRTIVISLCLSLLVFLLTACSVPVQPVAQVAAPEPLAAAVPATAAPSPPPTVEPEPAAIVNSDVVTLTVIYTSDEHGWMAGMEPGSGAADLLGQLQQELDYAPGGPFLLLSGGDNWTGPAISTWFHGQSMVEVMNAMGYAASAVGNHEFDFGLETLKRRTEQADFPYLAANLRKAAGGSFPDDLGVRPYALAQVAGLQVGLIGLANMGTPLTTNPLNVASFDFIDYEQALREIVPEVRAAGADLIIVPSHGCAPEMVELARRIEDLGVDLLGAGHCHQLWAGQEGEIAILAGGAYLTGYATARFRVDPAADSVSLLGVDMQLNQGGPADPAIAAIVERWQAETDAELNVVIGYLAEPIQRTSQPMFDLISESWLRGYPADIAITNLGGIRDGLPAGEITIADIISVLPFDNTLVDVTLTGQQLEQALAGKLSDIAVGGMHRDGFHWVSDSTGERLEADRAYSVLVNDFMFAGGDGFTLLAHYDPDAYDTAINWRQPVIDWLLAQKSSLEQPLDAAIAGLAD